MTKILSKAVLLFFAALLLLGVSCRPVYNIGNTPYTPVFEKDNEFVTNISSNSNNVHELNLSFKGKSQIYYHLSGGLGSRNYLSEDASLTSDYRTNESMFKLGIGLDNLLDEQFGLLLNAGIRKNRNIISEYPSFHSRPPENRNITDDFTNIFQGVELIPYVHLGKKRFITTLGLALRNDIIIAQRGEYYYSGEFQSEILFIGQNNFYMDVFLNFLFKTQVVDFSLNITGTNLTEKYIEYPLRVALTLSKRFQLKSK